MAKIFLDLNKINAYKIADSLSDFVWDLVSSWDWFSKSTLGTQYVRAVDSIGGNIAEGFGRFHKKDKEKFFYNSRGSTYESIYWTEKSLKRKLMKQQEYVHILSELEKLPKEINWLIRITEQKLKI